MTERHHSFVTDGTARLCNKIALRERALCLLCDGNARDREVRQVLTSELHVARVELAALRGANAYMPSSHAFRS